MAHAAQVAFTFFAHIADKQERQRMVQAHGLQDGGDGQDGGDAGSVVRNAGAVQATALLAHVQRRAGGEYGVQVGAQGNVTVSKTAASAEDVSDFIGVDRVQAELFEFFREPRSASALAEMGARQCALAPAATCANCGSWARNQVKAERISGEAHSLAISCCMLGNSSDTSAPGPGGMAFIVVDRQQNIFTATSL